MRERRGAARHETQLAAGARVQQHPAGGGDWAVARLQPGESTFEPAASRRSGGVGGSAAPAVAAHGWQAGWLAVSPLAAAALSQGASAGRAVPRALVGRRGSMLRGWGGRRCCHGIDRGSKRRGCCLGRERAGACCHAPTPPPPLRGCRWLTAASSSVDGPAGSAAGAQPQQQDGAGEHRPP